MKLFSFRLGAGNLFGSWEMSRYSYSLQKLSKVIQNSPFSGSTFYLKKINASSVGLTFWFLSINSFNSDGIP